MIELKSRGTIIEHNDHSSYGSYVKPQTPLQIIIKKKAKMAVYSVVLFTYFTSDGYKEINKERQEDSMYSSYGKNEIKEKTVRKLPNAASFKISLTKQSTLVCYFSHIHPKPVMIW